MEQERLAFIRHLISVLIITLFGEAVKHEFESVSGSISGQAHWLASAVRAVKYIKQNDYRAWQIA